MYVMQPHKYKAKKGFWDEDKKGSEIYDFVGMFYLIIRLWQKA